VVEALVAHELAEHAGVGGKTRDSNAHVGVGFEDLLLVLCELVDPLPEGDEHPMVLGADAHTYTPLLDGFHGGVHLVQLALRRPRRAVPVVKSLDHLICKSIEIKISHS